MTFTPIPLAEVDSGVLVRDVEPNRDGEVLLRVLDRGWPVAQRVEAGLRTAEDIRRRAARIGERSPAPAAWAPAPPSAELVTVVICTLGTDPGLRPAVEATLAQAHRAIDLVVVDNDPASGRAARRLAGIADERLRIVGEPRRGLSAARNAGLAHARGSLVAFTDDDALPHPRWIAEIAGAFAADRDGAVACVTGLVLAAELETEAQRFFEQCSGFGKGFEAMRWGPAGELAALTVPGVRGVAFPYSGGEFGSGNNMAFRTEALRALGGFDEALGAGTPTRGGEDLDIFRRVYLAGHGVVYLPAALVGHRHRRELDALRSQMYGYGTGMAAVITKVTLRGHAPAILRRLPASLDLLLRSGSAKNERKSETFPADVTRAELKGYLHGPFLYLKARRAARRGAS